VELWPRGYKRHSASSTSSSSATAIAINATWTVTRQAPLQLQATASPIGRFPRLCQCPTTAAKSLLRHARPRTKVVTLTRNDTCEAQRAAMKIRKELTRKGRSGDRDWTPGNILCHARLKARFNHVPIVFTGMAAACTQSTHQLPSLDEYYLHTSQAQPSGPSQAQPWTDAPLRASNKRSHQVTGHPAPSTECRYAFAECSDRDVAPHRKKNGRKRLSDLRRDHPS
jgi:hypothetical protein